MAKRKDTAVPTEYNPAAGYQRPPGGDQATSTTGNDGNVVVTPPPARNQNPFINAMFLYQLGKPVHATINGIRNAVNTNPKIQNKGWFVDMTLENGQKVCGRVNEGDQRHERLFKAYGASWVGKTVLLRLPHPGDATKAAWTLDPK